MIETIKRILGFILLILFILWNINCFGQDTLKPADHRHNVIGFVTEDMEQINGLALGIWNQPDMHHEQQINGMQLELVGSGWVTPFLFLDDEGYIPKSRDHLQNNGLLIGTTLLAGKINGVGISPFVITHHDLNGMIIAPVTVTLYTANGSTIAVINYVSAMNGLQVGIYNNTQRLNGLEAGIYNQCDDYSRGVQVGLINRSNAHRGIQIGLVNIIGKRITPIVNWSFKPFSNAG
ncbi:MAG: hypothetical protein JWO44_58 [Bacteroidetes bacterium]|jgi:hypothetical protein|nr:hypothetical protein [Bacteroidota bacterium]